MQDPPSLDFIYFDAGGGHRSAALALQSVIESQGRNWNVRLVNLQEVLDPLDVFRKITGLRSQDIYNRLLAKGWTLGAPQLLFGLQQVIRTNHASLVKLLTSFWGERRPDMVVSLIPNLNRAAFEALQSALPGVPYVGILTDFADYPPHFWMEKQDQYFICGTERAAQQAQFLGHSESKIMRVSGMILGPQFYEEFNGSRQEERAKLGLDPNRATGLVLFGGEGSNKMYSIAERLGNSDINVQLVMLCGRNKRLKIRLEQLKTKNKLVVQGFTKKVPDLMRLSDFFIGKPGPGSISEAVHMKLPVIVESNRLTLPQERYNTQWVKQQGVGIVVDSFRDVENAVRNLFQSGCLDAVQANLAGMDNRAVFEIPPLLESILSTTKKPGNGNPPRG